MPVSRRIFISHRNHEPEVIALIDEMSRRLCAIGFEVLVDFERMKPGATWRDEIYTWLGVCHAGVVLISPGVLADDSVWVPRESSILAWRKTLEPSFTLIPVLLPRVTTDDLRSDLRFRDLGLHDLQVITHATARTTCAEIIDGVAHLNPAPRTPLEDLAEQIQVLLGAVQEEFLREAMALAGVRIDRLQHLGNPARTLALALLQLPLKGAVNVLEYLASRISTLSAVDRILDIIAPGWVDLAAARWIAVCTAMPDPRPAAVVNARTRFTAEMYVRRASCRPPKTMWRVIAVTGVHGELMFEDLATEITAALHAEFSTNLLNDPFDVSPESRLVTLLRELNCRGRPVVVAMRLPAEPADLMPLLQERFPYLTFLFLSGDMLPDPVACPVRLLRRVEPALTPGQESAAKTEYEVARSILRPGIQIL